MSNDKPSTREGKRGKGVFASGKRNQDSKINPTGTAQSMWKAGSVADLLSDRCFQGIILLTIIALVLRLYRLDFNSLWLDEAVTLRFARLPMPAVFDVMVHGEYNPPLFFWVEHIAIMFGDSEWMLRIVPAVVGTLTVPAFFILGRMFLGRPEGLLAAALLTFSPFHIYYSQEARPYVLALFLITVSLIFLLKGCESGKMTEWIAGGLLAAAALWCHFYVAVLIIPLFAYLFLKTYFRTKTMLLPCISGIAVFLAACLPLFYQGLRLAGMRVAGGAVFGSRGLTFISSVMTEFSWYNVAAVLVFVFLLVLGLWSLFRQSKEKAFFILCCVLVPVLVSIPLSYMIPMTPRYLIILLPFLALGISASLSMIQTITRKKTAFVLLLAIIVVINIPALTGYYTENQKETWREFSGSFSQLTGPGDQVVLIPGYIGEPFEYYYDSDRDGTSMNGISTYNDLIRVNDQNGRTWFITTTDLGSIDAEGTMSAWLQHNTTRVSLPANGIYLSYRGGPPVNLPAR